MKHKKIIFCFIYSFLLVLLFTSCKKNTEPINETISEITKQFYLFQKGSYWIYQNDKNLQIDCTYINNDPKFWQEYFRKDDGSIYAIKDHIDINYNGNIFQFSNIDSQLVQISTQ